MKPRILAASLVVLSASCSVVLLHAANLPDGKKLFSQKGCIGCHAVGGPSQGPGPELTQVTYHRDATWLHHWLSDPQQIKKGTVMPKFPWKSQAEQDAVIEYLRQARTPIPAADSTDGARLFADFKCGACHAIAKHGGQPQFPDLAASARSRDAAWLDRWLADPAAVKQGTFMAKFPLTTTQRTALIKYIVSLRQP